jgi:hypothetical protein
MYKCNVCYVLRMPCEPYYGSRPYHFSLLIAQIDDDFAEAHNRLTLRDFIISAISQC